MEFNLNDIIQLVGSLGFPIVACGYMMVTNNKTLKELTTAVNSLTSAVQILLHEGNEHVHENGLSYVKGDSK